MPPLALRAEFGDTGQPQRHQIGFAIVDRLDEPRPTALN
jgi:hypothetical protein